MLLLWVLLQTEVLCAPGVASGRPSGGRGLLSIEVAAYVVFWSGGEIGRTRGFMGSHSLDYTSGPPGGDGGPNWVSLFSKDHACRMVRGCVVMDFLR